MANETMPAESPGDQKPLVLVVDDEYGPRESIAFTLSGEFNVETADRAADAIARIRERPFAAVVMDIRMPEMDGVRALEELRKHDAAVSVIMLTGYGTLLTAQQAMAAGANQYLRKPPDVNELIEAVRRQTAATRLRRQQARIAREAIELNAALKREVEKTEPQVWQGRASVELVHDLNNPLTVVIGYATLLVEEARQISLTDPERGRKLMEYAVVLERAAEYCHHLAENWRRTSKKLGDYEPIDLVAVIREVRQVIFFGNSAIQIGGAETASVRGSKFELMRIFQNLMSNSLEAGAKRVEVAVHVSADGVEVTMRDDGTGMDADDLKRALRGGFTSKASGTGLGLSICRHLLGAHGATFELTSERGRGTTVRSRFPTGAGA
jgi:signal transduction histidine kinase